MKFSRRRFLTVTAGVLYAGCGDSMQGAAHSRTVAWGGAGRRNGSFLEPRAIGVAGGEVYVVDTTGRIQVLTGDGVYVRQWSVPEADNGTPTCVAFDREGRVLIPDTHYHRVLVYTPEGDLLEQWGTYGPGPDEFVYPTGIVEGSDGALYISEYGEDAERIHVFDKNRRFVRQWGGFGEGPGQFNRAMAIDLGRDGTLYVLDTGNNRVQRFDTEGTLVGVIGESGTAPGQLKDPMDIAVAPDGTVLVCEYGNYRISRFTADGAFMGCAGEAGRGLGQFDGPRGIAVSDSGTIFVADTGNHRIQRLDLGDLG